MPTNLTRAGTRPVAPIARTRNFDIVALALVAALVVLQFAGLVILQRSRTTATPLQPPQPAACAESPAPTAAQIPYD